MEVQRLCAALMSKRVEARLDALGHLESVSPGDLPDVFAIILADFSHVVRERAARLVTLCPSIYASFLDDPVPRVRVAIVERSVELRAILRDPAGLLAKLGAMARDSARDVRVAVARALRDHARVTWDCDPVTFATLNVRPIIQTLLSDRDDDVRIAASANLIEIATLHGFEFLFEHFLAQLRNVLRDAQWRVRVNGVQLLLGMGMVTPVEYFNENLLQFVAAFLRDSALKVREFTVSALPALAEKFGRQWVVERLAAELARLAKSQIFMERQTALLGLAELLDFLPESYRANYFFHPAIRLLRDPVQNVVLVAIDVLWRHNGAMHPFRRQHEMKPLLEAFVEAAGPTVAEKAAAFLLECQ
jgi:HEAT repeat protein